MFLLYENLLSLNYSARFLMKLLPRFRSHSQNFLIRDVDEAAPN